MESKLEEKHAEVLFAQLGKATALIAGLIARSTEIENPDDHAYELGRQTLIMLEITVKKLKKMGFDTVGDLADDGHLLLCEALLMHFGFIKVEV